ncbi:tRNA guanosine(34) transglycosylase Tgt [Candidatus Kaiserbacteria bacterium CG10_big_fil_rev_8_21_14_0_10_59_10]|uniref:Queuine tRNA-ribosyltransferase n=1 Tax=Candidatus Kaiserbacteria bacterium CG10_big_fil_rev_8_21_14_0_10_59_10 TaxID=1974612 RepID=A0A2H0U9Z5_9BACT|nr:MAG: tRNA guanosine(34) transglycosylase Tgt [Candidatus Kaiserbacteria bacterium CG10_big_fil_rev_8_21_14_0_10_59_10]
MTSFGFKILKRSKKSRARLGVISTPHGEIETPAFVPVATNATVRMLDSTEIAALGSQVLICNTYHLHLAPGGKLIKKAGGLHAFMHWNKPLMTDSGGFQVYSLGFGTDHGIGKVLKTPTGKTIERDAQPVNVRITDEGVHFRSPIDGTALFLGPKESIRIQEALGADIIFAFDECPSPVATKAYMRESLEKTHRWAKQCLEARRSKLSALYGIVQGGKHRDLREESARLIGALPFEGFAVGGEYGYDKPTMGKLMGWVSDILPEEKPRHALGIGHPEDFAALAKSGMDTFDCIAPTHYARRGVAFTSRGRLDMRAKRHLTEHKALDQTCACDVCGTYSRSYISHLVRKNELTGLKLLTMHNLHYFNALAAHLRAKIKNGQL